MSVVNGQLEALRHLVAAFTSSPGNKLDAYNSSTQVLLVFTCTNKIIWTAMHVHVHLTLQTPLHLAVLRDDQFIVELLLEHGAAADVVTKKGNNALHLSTMNGFHR